MNEISTEPVPVNQNNEQAGLLKNIVLDLGWFNRGKTKFEVWWRGMRLFLKSNRVMETNNRITMILAYHRRDIAGIYALKKLNELDEEIETQDWDKFVQDIKMTFSDKTKAADTKQKIETFKQEKKNIVDFIIEFKILAMKTNTDELYTICLLKKNMQANIIKMILGYPPIAAPETFKEQKVVITSIEQEYKSTEGQQDYRTALGVIYRGGVPMDIVNAKDNFKNRKSKYFN